LGKQKPRSWMTVLSDGRILSQKELVELGAHPQTLRRMVEAYELANPAHGLYQSIEAASEFNELDQFAVIAKIAPTSMIWLLSAAQHHGITQVMPDGIYTALRSYERGIIVPGGTFGDIDVKVTRLANEKNFTVGIEKTAVHGVEVSITSAARTIVDMWRYSVLNTALQLRFVKIDEETVYDAMASYVSKSGDQTGLADITSMASEFGVLDAMMPHLKAFEAGFRMARP
jgi:predicted transcriptional regulator of viral defense system